MPAGIKFKFVGVTITWSACLQRKNRGNVGVDISTKNNQPEANALGYASRSPTPPHTLCKGFFPRCLNFTAANSDRVWLYNNLSLTE